MESLVGYGSDEETDERYEAGPVGDGGAGSAARRDDDTNYDDVTMDMSEDSNNNESDRELPQAEPEPPASGGSRRAANSTTGQPGHSGKERGSPRRDRRRDSPPDRARRHDSKDARGRHERERSPRRDDKNAKSERGRRAEGSTSSSSSSSCGRRGLLGERPDNKGADVHKVPALMDLKPFGGEPPPVAPHVRHSDSRDSKDARGNDRERRERERDRELPRDKDRERERDLSRDKDRERERDLPRDKERERERDLPRDKDRERERELSRDKDRERERELSRDKDREREGHRDKEREGHRDKERRGRRSQEKKSKRRSRSRSRERLTSRERGARSERSRERSDRAPATTHPALELHPPYMPRGGGLEGRAPAAAAVGPIASSPLTPMPGEYRPSYKVSKKLQVMEKMGLQIKTPDGSMATAQQLMQRTVQEQQGAGSGPPARLPSYYQPGAVDASKITQLQKRKLLWGNKGKEGVGGAGAGAGAGERAAAPAAEVVPAAAVKWTGTKFAQDTDGKVASKFMRLMGIKDPAAVQPPANANVEVPDLNKKQEEMFQAMQAQYDVARVTTHTMRGVGLGFQRHY